MDTLLEGILYQALQSHASDIHIVTIDNEIQINFRVKGELIFYKCYELDLGKQLINYIRFLANIDLNHLMECKTGAFLYKVQSTDISLRVSYIPTIKGNNLVIRILGQNQFHKIEDLTTQQDAIDFLTSLSKKKSGLILISGPTGVGKSTTLHTMLQMMFSKRHLNIITIEDPIEIIEPNFIQIQLSFDEELCYDSALKQILRHDPDVVMIGEIRDELSAKIAIRLALTGCLVLSTIHANSCIGTLKRLFNLNLNKTDIQEVLLAVISQKLIYKKSLAVYEWVSKQSLTKYYETQILKYDHFDRHIQTLLEQGKITTNDLIGTDFE